MSREPVSSGAARFIVPSKMVGPTCEAEVDCVCDGDGLCDGDSVRDAVWLGVDESVCDVDCEGDCERLLLGVCVSLTVCVWLAVWVWLRVCVKLPLRV